MGLGVCQMPNKSIIEGDANMCQKIFKESELSEENYNLIVSNVILSQTEEFTYGDILENLKSMFMRVTEGLKNIVESCLIRLRDDGFIRVLGSKYTVNELAL